MSLRTLLKAATLLQPEATDRSGSGTYVPFSGLPISITDPTYGAVADAVKLTDAAITASAAILTSATAAFVSGDVGKTVSVAGAGAGGATLTTTIASRQSATQVTLAATATTTVSGATVFYGTDNQTAITNAIAAGKAAGRSVQVPPGKYLHSSTLTLDSVSLIGFGSLSQLIPASDTVGAIILTGTNPEVVNLGRDAAASIKQAPTNANSFVVNGTTGARVSGCTVLNSAGDGVHVRGSATLTRVLGNYIHVLYDGIHHTAGANHTVVADNIVSGGNNGIDVVSLTTDGVTCSDLVIRGNVVDGCAAYGIGVTGGSRIGIVGNTVTNITQAGIILTTGSSFAVTDCRILDNNVRTVSTDGTSHQGLIHLANTVSRVIIKGNNLTDGRYGGVTCATGPDDVIIDGNIIDDILGPAGVNVTGGSNYHVINNIIEDTDQQAVSFTAATTGVIRINGNRFKNNNRTSTAGIDVVLVSSSSTADIIEFCDNYHTNPAGYTLDRFFDCANSTPRLIVFNNHTTSGKFIVLGNNPDLVQGPTFGRRAIGTAAPTAGTWAVGDIVWNTTPASLGNIGWCCVTAGSPGTWKTFGSIS